MSGGPSSEPPREDGFELGDSRFSVLVPLGVALIAVLTAVVILLFEHLLHGVGSLIGTDWAVKFDEDEREFLGRGPTILWLSLLCVQTALWALFAFPLIRILRELQTWRNRATALLGLAALALPVAGFVLAGALADVERPLPGQREKVAILTTLAVAVAYLGALAAWRVHAAVEGALRLEAECRTGEDWLRRLKGFVRADGAPDDPVAGYVYLRDVLDRVLGMMAIIVGAAVLSTAALRKAMVAWQQSPPRGVDVAADQVVASEAVVLYGVFFSGLLALIYASPFQRLRTLGFKLRDAICPPKWPPDPGWKSQVEERSALESLLQLRLGTTASLRVGATVLAPFLTALVGQFLGVS